MAADRAETVTPDDLRKLQAAMGLHTQREFADALGVRQSYVSMLLSGEREVKPGSSLMIVIRKLQAEHRVSKASAAEKRPSDRPGSARRGRREED